MKTIKTKIQSAILYIFLLTGITYAQENVTIPYPVALTFDNAGNLYVIDRDAIRKISPNQVCQAITGVARYLAAFSGANDKNLLDANFFKKPTSVVVTNNNEILISDADTGTIKKITTSGTFGAPGNICSLSTIDSGSWIDGLCLDSEGNMYGADTIYSVIHCQMVSDNYYYLGGGGYTLPYSLAGSREGKGRGAVFNKPTNILFDNAGHFYIADTDNHLVRTVAEDGTVLFYAGSPGVSGTADGFTSQARFNNPKGMACDSDNNIYVADWGNSTIRMITHDGEIFTIAGQAGVTGLVDGTKQNALFNHPTDVAYDGNGNLYVADTNNSAIRKIQLSTGLVTTLVLRYPNDFPSTNNDNRLTGDNGGGFPSIYYFLSILFITCCQTVFHGIKIRKP